MVMVVGLWKGMNLQTKAYTYKEKGKEIESNQREMETMMDNLNFHPLCRRPLTNVLIHHLGIDFCFFLYFLILSLSLSHQYSTFQQCPTKVIIRQKKKKKYYSCARDSNKSNYTSKVILTTWIQNLKKKGQMATMNEYDGTNANVLRLAMIDDWNYYVGYTVINEYNKLSLVPQVFTRIKSYFVPMPLFHGGKNSYFHLSILLGRKS